MHVLLPKTDMASTPFSILHEVSLFFNLPGPFLALAYFIVYHFTTMHSAHVSHTARGYLLIMLHAHLPFIRYPEHENFLEENWLYETITETYIPLINIFENLVDDGVDFRISLSLTPPLIEMLNDELLMNRYQRYLCKLIELSEKSYPGTGKTSIQKLQRCTARGF
jgi:hypothetical protein